MLLKQLEDGHVMTLASTMGHCITVSIRDARPVLVLNGGANATFDEQETLGERLEENVFTSLVINNFVHSIMSYRCYHQCNITLYHTSTWKWHECVDLHVHVLCMTVYHVGKRVFALRN